MRTFVAAVRHPSRWLRDLCGGEAAFPLVVLFGLNAVDELDRTAFGILLPNIRDEFNLDNTKVLGLVALVSIAALALQVPIAQFADRSRRVPLAIAGAVAWALFSGLTGLATGVIMLTIARSGSAVGKAVIDPTHNSLIADYFPIESRSRVFSVHRAANAIGAFVGPLSAGLLAYAFGWRAAVPVLRHSHDGVRGHGVATARADPRALGASGDGRQRRCDRHRGNGAVVRRELANGAEDREPQAHLVEPAVPRDRLDRLRGTGVVVVRAGVRARRARPRHRVGHRRALPTGRSRRRVRASSRADSWATCAA